MFVEGVRLFVVLLGTAAGFWVARDLGSESEAVAAMIGCLAGYVGGGMLGRLLDRALGVVERRVEHDPTRAGRRRNPRRDRRRIRGRAPRAAGIAPPPGPGRDPDRGSPLVDHGLARLPHPREQERQGARDARSVDATRSCARRRSTRVTVCSSTRRSSWTASCSRSPRSGILGSDLLVPRFVLDEVQGFGDSPDETRRRRATRGMETLETLRDEGSLRLYVLDHEVPDYVEVDAKLDRARRSGCSSAC